MTDIEIRRVASLKEMLEKVGEAIDAVTNTGVVGEKVAGELILPGETRDERRALGYILGHLSNAVVYIEQAHGLAAALLKGNPCCLHKAVRDDRKWQEYANDTYYAIEGDDQFGYDQHEYDEDEDEEEEDLPWTQII